MPVNASREMIHAILTSRAIPSGRVHRQRIGDLGELACPIVTHLPHAAYTQRHSAQL